MEKFHYNIESTGKENMALEGLAAYKARKEAEEARKAEASKPRLNRFNLVKDGDSAVVRFAQEIDFDATNYNADRGIGFVNIEHNHPDPNNGWKNRANCSLDSQGACLPCEKVTNRDVDWEDRKGWKQKEKFYINVIAGEAVEVDNPNAKGKNKKAWLTTDIDKKTGDGVVYLLEQGTYNGIYNALSSYAIALLEDEDEDGSTITDKFFKIERKGNDFNNTSYVLTPIKEIPKAAKSLDDFELIDIKEDVLNEVEYAKQDAFYHQNVAAEVKEPAWSGAGASDSDATSTDSGW